MNTLEDGCPRDSGEAVHVLYVYSGQIKFNRCDPKYGTHATSLLCKAPACRCAAWIPAQAERPTPAWWDD